MTWGPGARTCALVAVAVQCVGACACSGEDAHGTGGHAGASTSTAAQGGIGVGGFGGVAGTGGTGTAGGIQTTKNCDPPSGADALLKLTKLVDVSMPTYVTQPPGISDWLIVVTHPGVIYRLEGGTLSVFLDISPKVFNSGESGLVGLAFHPDYADNGRFFVHYVSQGGSGGTSRVEEYRRSAGNPKVAEPDPVGAPYIQVEKTSTNHSGGMIEFSPVDGMLYIGLGDGGAPFDVSQYLNSFLGKLLRIDVATNPHQIPVGNMMGGAPEIWDFGLRQPYRFSFDACSGDLYLTDVGANQWEEIEIERPGAGSNNYGWWIEEGNQCYQFPNCDPNNLLASPSLALAHSDGWCAIVGGFVYRGSAIPWLRGRFVFGDFCFRVASLVWNGTEVSDLRDHSTDLGVTFSPSTLGQDNDGELYVTNWYGGEVFRLDAE